MKAFIGMGLLGSNFVKAMLQKGGQVQVWNRTASKAKALEADGAKAFDNVANAVKGASEIHVTLKDDASVNEVLALAENGFDEGAIIIDHTTTSAKGAIGRTALWHSKGFTYLHAPVFMGPANALAGTGIMLASGNQLVIEILTDTLAKMTGKFLNLGAEEGKAAGVKLTGNCFLINLTAGIADALGVAKAHGIPAADIIALFSTWNPGAMAPARMQKISEGDFSNPSWELNMARKDAQLIMNAAADGGTSLVALPAIAAAMDAWIQKGHGNDDWSIIAKNSI